MARLNDLGTQITTLRALKAESGSRSAQAQSNPDRVQDVLNNVVIANMKTELTRQESHLEEALSRYGDAHPVVLESQANINKLKQQLRTETGRVTASVSLNNKVNFAREAEAVRAYNEQRNHVLKLKEDRSELQVLEKELESAQRIYDSIQTRLSQTALESNSNQSSISILSPATEPIKPSSPKILINTLVAATLGSFLAVMVALGIEFLDRKVRGPFDLVQALGLPVLGVLPGQKSKKLFWQRIRQRPEELSLAHPLTVTTSAINAIETV